MAEVLKTDARDTCPGQQRVKGAMEQIACMQRFPLRFTKHEVLIQPGCARLPASFLLAKTISFERIDSQGGELSTEGTPWRQDQDMPPSAEVITSAYDVEARYRRKRNTI